MNTPTHAPESLHARIDLLTERMDQLLERQRAMSELVAESGPILAAMMDAGTTRFAELEDRGMFAFARSMMGLVDKVSAAYSPDDVDQLGDAVVGILDTVRNLTQSDVLAVANDAADVMHRSHTLEPVGVMGAMRRSRDEDVQRGIAVMLEVLKQLGKVTDATPGASSKERRLARHLAPSKGLPAARIPRRAPPPAMASRLGSQGGAPAKAAAPAARSKAPAQDWSAVVGPEFVVDDGGFLVDPSTWTREFAQTVADHGGLGTLSPEHWQVIEAMRADYLASGSSPNVRKLGKISGVGTKALYQLFKTAPGSAAARISGVPKPVGCI